MTGFVTPPDMDKVDITKNNTSTIKMNGEIYDSLSIRRKGRGEYFRDIVLFGDRDKDFKNYMYQLFSRDNIEQRYSVLRDYIRMFSMDSDIQNNYMIKTEDVLTEFNTALVINGLKIGYND